MLLLFSIVQNNFVNASLALPATDIDCKFSPTGSDLLYIASFIPGTQSALKDISFKAH